jgi:ubiquinone/menaquinone biosynthesis C-methylase UbiE
VAFHTYPLGRADALEDPSRYRFCSREELVAPLAGAGVVADLGSGTGFYTDDVAPDVGTVVAVDVQPGMHARYREKDVPGNVALLTAGVTDLPLADGSLDAAFSTMTYHEFATPDALAQLRRGLRSGAPLVTVDWAASGTGESGPPTDERFALGTAREQLDAAGFAVERAERRPETWFVLARRP